MSCIRACLACVVKPASTKQRKTYNTLVPALFTGEPIKLDEQLDSTLRRKIQKLQEYVQKNPAKIPKVGAPCSVISLAMHWRSSMSVLGHGWPAGAWRGQPP